MPISFFETMSGELFDEKSEERPIRFEIKGEATDAYRFWRSGRVKITGVVDAPPLADEAPLEGEMVISPLRRRQITYRFRFNDIQGRPCQFTGRKEISFLKPVHSMTHMTGLIERDGAFLASGELRFELEDLPEFVTSWWPSTTIPRMEMHSPLNGDDSGGTLSEGERELLAAAVGAIFVAGEAVPAPDEKTVDAAVAQLHALPGHAFWFYRLGLRFLDYAPMASHRRRFTELPLHQRRRLLAQWTDPSQSKLPGPPMASLAIQLLTTIIKVAHFGRYDYLDAIGHPRPQQVAPEPRERYMRRVVAAEDLGEETELQAHVVVVGTGAGGAAVAYQLAKQGLAVAMVEEGRYFQRQDFSGPPMDRVRSMYRHRATNFSLGTPIIIPQGRTVGGTTTINSGTCFTTPDEVLEEWRKDLGFPDDFRPENYHPYSTEVGEMLQVAPGESHALGKIADVIARGADELGLDHGPLPRNAPGCPGAGECILGCPEGAKQSTDVSYVPAALRAGAELYVGLPVTRILMNGSRAVAVEARGSDNRGRPRRLRIKADRIVLACGAVHSPLLLRENGFTLPWIGKNLSVHPGMGLLARVKEDLEPWKTIPQGYAIHALEDRGVRFEGYYLHPQLTAPTLPWVGERLTEWMDDFRRIAQFGFMIRDRGTGRVRRGPNGIPLISYSLTPPSIDRLKEASSLLAEVLLEAGADRVYAGFGPDPVVRSRHQARRLKEADAGPLDFRLLGAHPLGTCRMAADRQKGVVDFDHRVFGTDNLHVVDGSSVPTSLGVNPQMTIMAMALRAGDRIASLI